MCAGIHEVELRHLAEVDLRLPCNESTEHWCSQVERLTTPRVRWPSGSTSRAILIASELARSVFAAVRARISAEGREMYVRTSLRI